jgi:prophage DNA circulation protein
VVAVVERAGDSLEHLLATVPRLRALLEQAEMVVTEVSALVARIELTRAEAQAVARRTEETLASAELLVSRAGSMVESLEPPLSKLQPTLERLAETTSPQEVEALVDLVDHLPGVLDQVERDVLPMMRTLGSVSPDLHDLLDVSRELNEMLAKLPGMGRIKKKVDEQQAEDAADE